MGVHKLEGELKLPRHDQQCSASNLETLSRSLVLAFAMSADQYSAGGGYHQAYCGQKNQGVCQHPITSV